MVHNALTPKYYFFLQNQREKYLCESKNSHIVFSPFPQAFEAALLIFTFCESPA